MGPEGWGGVVNAKLQVYGTSNVRVVDASVMPVHIATHIQQTVYGIGELVSCRRSSSTAVLIVRHDGFVGLGRRRQRSSYRHTQVDGVYIL